MSYVVIARKWRPQEFGDVLGQEHVTRTITNAINAGRIAHAFLFSGPRGVGKTSAARILAKALCCEKTGAPTASPCGVCAQCVEITEGRSTDVFEIDAASHTGVDNVREIIDNVRYLPSSARFKIYVIDEVHMLSTGAFNALLKTLEEPPPHVKFILATTDVHKVPVTILSRCQRYDFRRISITAIADRLSSILDRESIAHEKSALMLIAREAEGSMRDAQSLLEQVLAFADARTLDAALVRDALAVVDGAIIARVFEAIFSRQPGTLIELVSEVHHRGLDLKRFADALVEHARDLLAAKLVSDPSAVLDRPKDEIAGLVDRAKRLDSVTIERLFDQLCLVVEDVSKSSHPRFALEIGLASIAERPERVPVEELLAQLGKIEASLAGVGPSPSSALKRPSTDWRTRAQSAPYVATEAPPAAASPATPAPPKAAASAPESLPPPAAAAPSPASAAAPPPASAAPPSPTTAAPSPASAAPSPAPPAARPDPSASFAGFVDLLRRKRPSLAATLAQVRPLNFQPKDTELGCETAFDEAKLKDHDTRTYLEELLTEYFGQRTVLRVTRTSRGTAPTAAPEAAPPPRTLTEVEDDTREARRSEKGTSARASSAVKALSEELGASVTKVRVIDE